MADGGSDDPKSPAEHQRMIVRAAWDEYRRTTQMSGEETVENTVASWRGPTTHFKREELGLQPGEVSIFHTMRNLDAINRRNKKLLAQQEGAELAADKARITKKKQPRDGAARDKAVRKLLKRAGICIRGGVLSRY